MTRLSLIGSTREFQAFIEAAFTGGAPLEIEATEASGFDPLLVDKLVAADPDLVVVGPELGDDDALKLIEAVDHAAPHIGCVLVANATPELWPLALRAGARDIVAPLSGEATLRESFERAIEAGRRLRGVVGSAAGEPEGGRVITVVSAKGGSGKTTVAANLAATIAKRRPDDTVLVDFDVQFGDVCHAFRLDPEYSLLNAVAPGVTPTVLKGFLTPHASHVLALAAPDHPEEADDIDAESATRTVRDLASLFSSVVVDTAAGLDERTLAVLEASTDVVLVTATDVPSVRAAVKESDILERLGLLEGRRQHLVLNRADARVGLSVGDIEETIGIKASLSIPSTRAIPTALNLGEPLVLADERNPVTRGFNKFAEQIGVVPRVNDASRSWRFGK